VKLVAVCLLMMALRVAAVAQQQDSRLVTDVEARKLVMAALPSSAKRLPKFGLEGGLDSHDPRFYVFMAYWAGAPNGSMVIGHYAVDTSTADVWDAVMACQELSTPALRKLQVEVHSRLGLSEAQYRKVKRRCPLEMEGEAGARQ
jgi:hypothetical protein